MAEAAYTTGPTLFGGPTRSAERTKLQKISRFPDARSPRKRGAQNGLALECAGPRKCGLQNARGPGNHGAAECVSVLSGVPAGIDIVVTRALLAITL